MGSILYNLDPINFNIADLAPLLQQDDSIIEYRDEQDVRADDLEDIWATVSTQLSHPTNVNKVIFIQGMVFASIAKTEFEVLMGHYE